eukprot:SAG11_NODE_17790_length_508_cov_2.589242_2_plen_74_part_01
MLEWVLNHVVCDQTRVEGGQRLTCDYDSVRDFGREWGRDYHLQFTDLHLRPAPKLNPRYYGPFDVVSQPGANRF